MDEQEIRYAVDGVEFVGLLVLPDGDGPFPGVLVAHEGPGLSDHELGVARRLAGLGYVALALDYHGGGAAIEDRAAMMERLGVLSADPDLTRSIARAALNELLAAPRIDTSRVAAIGYCFGGAVVLELGRSGADVDVIVGFHAALATTRPEDAANIRARVLVCMGSDDPIITEADRAAFEAEMRATSVDWQLHVYGGAQHTFTNPAADDAALPGIAYHTDADRRSWRAMLELFDETFARPG